MLKYVARESEQKKIKYNFHFFYLKKILAMVISILELAYLALGVWNPKGHTLHPT